LFALANCSTLTFEAVKLPQLLRIGSVTEPCEWVFVVCEA